MEGALSLTGLIGAGSIPATILGVAILIFFSALVALKIYLLKTETKHKEKPMHKKISQSNCITNVEKLVLKALLTTIVDVGTEVVSGSGMALLG